MKVAEGFAAANSMIWRQSPSATTVEQNGGTRPLWIMRAGNLSMDATNATDGGLWGWAGLSGNSRSTVGGFNSRPLCSVVESFDFRHGWPVVQNAGNFCDLPRCVGGVGFN